MEKLHLSTHFFELVPICLAGLITFFKKDTEEKIACLGDNYPYIFSGQKTFSTKK